MNLQVGDKIVVNDDYDGWGNYKQDFFIGEDCLQYIKKEDRILPGDVLIVTYVNDYAYANKKGEFPYNVFNVTAWYNCSTALFVANKGYDIYEEPEVEVKLEETLFNKKLFKFLTT